MKKRENWHNGDILHSGAYNRGRVGRRMNNKQLCETFFRDCASQTTPATHFDIYRVLRVPPSKLARILLFAVVHGIVTSSQCSMLEIYRLYG
ncbi:hypothetical protein I7I50_05764 [Histoplasma capsulatum G186AR]|uniref:Uncharacterized protein n=1 Tax=Ajellomyces capsulatus TaxID=5037 RepID=A0A8H7ZCQ6_AJECA|nr:hypothetical protein I7I52_04024 [Histoplasma capsulatum]QSS76346.1 hypothetical protein I7I50_05764 [Histoplasma capsulatum G186AR]